MDDDLDRRDTSDTLDSGLELRDDPLEIIDVRRLSGARPRAGHDSTLATLTAGVYMRGGVALGVGSAPTKTGVGGVTSSSGSKNEGRLAKGVCTGTGSGDAITRSVAPGIISSSGVSSGITSLQQDCVGIACPDGGGNCDGAKRKTTSVQRLKM